MSTFLKKAVIPLILFTCLIVLGGCTWWAQVTPVLEAELLPASGHPPFSTTVIVEEGDEVAGDTLYVYRATGQDAVETTATTLEVVVDVYPWSCIISRTDSKGNVSETVVRAELENEVAVAHNLWTIPNIYSDRLLIRIDLRHLWHGCDGATGDPLFATGFEDPDYTGDGYSMKNDGFTYRVEVEDVATGQLESVFYGPDRTLMGDEFVETPFFNWFVNYTGALPFYQYATRQMRYSCVVPTATMGCTPSPPPTLIEGEGMVEKRIHVYVLEWGTARHWVYTVFAYPGSCS